MPFTSRLRSLWRNLRHRDRVDRDLDDEVRTVFELLVDEKVNAGRPPAEARRMATLQLGRPESIKTHVRDIRAGAIWEAFLQDVRYGARALIKTPGVTLATLLVLALGVGATTAIFSVISGVLFRPLPFMDPDRLVQFGTTAIADFEELRGDNRSFEGLVAYQSVNRNLQGPDGPERVTVVLAERGLFDLLGAAPLVGRTFSSDDAAGGAVVSESFWIRRFGRETSPGNQQIVLDGTAYTVVGVMPDRFQFPYRAVGNDIWIPMTLPQATGRFQRIDTAIGRLEGDVTFESSRAELEAIARRLQRAYPESNRGRAFDITPLSEAVVGRSRNSLLMLFGAVLFILLIACANVTHLLLARSEARTPEMLIRSALGAGRGRMLRQLLTESLLLATIAGFAALLVGVAGMHLLVTLGAPQIPRASEIGLDWRVFTFLFAICGSVGLGCGLAPALKATRGPGNGAGAAPGGRGSSRPGSAATYNTIVVTEVALAFVLLMGAGLLLRAVVNLTRVPTGLVAEHVLTLRIDARNARLPESENSGQPGSPTVQGRYFGQIEERVLQIPGVRAAGFATTLPLQGNGWTGSFAIEGQPALPDDRRPTAVFRNVTPGYFRALGIPLRHGRLFAARAVHAPSEIVVNEAFVRRHLGNEDPTDRVVLDRGRIVGVVGDVRQILTTPAAPEIYFPLPYTRYSAATLAVSASLPPETLVGAIRTAVRDINPDQAIFDVRTMDRVISQAHGDLNLYFWLMALFACLALVLSVAGIYAVIAFVVTSHRKEHAIRLALGADGRRLLREVLIHGSWLIGGGVSIGALGALAVTRFLRALLYGVTPTDPSTFALAVLVLGAVGLAACAIPARRVLRLEPIAVLRCE